MLNLTPEQLALKTTVIIISIIGALIGLSLIMLLASYIDYRNRKKDQ